jgi:hypothetical protein
MTRVEQAASKIPGSKILNHMPDFRSMGMNRDQVTSAMMQYNRKWILEQMRSGRQIIDIGADVNRARPSIFFEKKGKRGQFLILICQPAKATLPPLLAS